MVILLPTTCQSFSLPLLHGVWSYLPLLPQWTGWKWDPLPACPMWTFSLSWGAKPGHTGIASSQRPGPASPLGFGQILSLLCVSCLFISTQLLLPTEKKFKFQTHKWELISIKSSTWSCPAQWGSAQSFGARPPAHNKVLVCLFCAYTVEVVYLRVQMLEGSKGIVVKQRFSTRVPQEAHWYASRIFKTCTTWLFSQGHWPLFP